MEELQRIKRTNLISERGLNKELLSKLIGLNINKYLTEQIKDELDFCLPKGMIKRINTMNDFFKFIKLFGIEPSYNIEYKMINAVGVIAVNYAIIDLKNEVTNKLNYKLWR